ncbi:MAG: patatin-like phospholipase family protein [Candidatus Colwellbacteria bacterium]|nr:patatin-like phospholipase family protein [Candidatus Colwellbacteria bacterium]
MAEKRQPKIGLALGGGASRGLAHIGVIKILEENNIPIHCIAGTSIGAIIGGCYATGLSVQKMEEITLAVNWRSLFVLIDPRLKQGLLGGKKIRAFIETYVGGKRFEDCKIPFAAIATDLKTGEAVILKEGEMTQSIRASISLPLVFQPVAMGGRTLIDGGLSMPVPVRAVKDMGADFVIAANLYEYQYAKKLAPNWYDISNSSLSILHHHLALYDVSGADVVININVGKDSWYRFDNGYDKIITGEEETRKILPQLREMIGLSG